MADQLEPADVALISRVLGHEIEPDLVRTLGPSTLAAIIQAARSEGPHPESGDDECPNPKGCAYCHEFGCPRASPPPLEGAGDQYLLSAFPDQFVPADRAAFDARNNEAPEALHGYVYFNPDTGTEWAESHPVESGEVSDAQDVRPATAAEATFAQGWYAALSAPEKGGE